MRACVLSFSPRAVVAALVKEFFSVRALSVFIISFVSAHPTACPSFRRAALPFVHTHHHN